MEYVIVERDLEEPLSTEEVRSSLEDPDGCYRLWRVEHVVTLLARDGRRTVCVFRAPDAASVRSVIAESGGGPYDRLYTSEWISLDP
jgi:hypothetical protein